MLPKILKSNPRKRRSLPSGFCRWVYGGHQLLLGPKTKQKGYLSILTKHQRRIFIAKWMQMQHSPDCGNCSFDRQLKRVRPGASSRPLDETRSWNNSSSTAKGDSQQVDNSSSGKIVFCINLQDRVMTRVGDLAPALCDGRVLPTSCSGLALVSRWYDSTI